MNKLIELTNLKPDATDNDIIELCKNAKSNDYHAVCVNPCYIDLAYRELYNFPVRIVTVIGFPLGIDSHSYKYITNIELFTITICMWYGNPFIIFIYKSHNSFITNFTIFTFFLFFFIITIIL